jgi:multidrug resistance efflux pump
LIDEIKRIENRHRCMLELSSDLEEAYYQVLQKTKIYESPIRIFLAFVAILTVASMFVALFLYWAFVMHSDLHIDRAWLAAPQLEIKTDQVGRLAFAPHEEGASVSQGDILFSFNTDNDFQEEQQLQATAESLKAVLTYHLACVEQATQEYIAARSEVELACRPTITQNSHLWLCKKTNRGQ